MKIACAAVCLGIGMVLSALGADAPEPSESFRETLSAELPFTARVKLDRDREDLAGVLAMKPMVPFTPAPSAQAAGPNLYAYQTKGTFYFAETDAAHSGASPFRPVIPAKVGEVETRMVLDSAADGVLLAPWLAGDLDLPAAGTGHTWTLGVDDPCELPRVIVPRLTVGPVTFENVPALIIPEGAAMWDDTGGVFPLWLLRKYALHYDRRKEALTVYPRGTPPEEVLGEGAFRVPCGWREKRLSMGVGLRGGRRVRLLVSTNSGSTYLDAPTLEGMGISTTTRLGSLLDTGHLGRFTGGVAEELELRIGDARILMPTVGVLRAPPRIDPAHSGVLGRDVLSLFELFLDTSSGACYLKGYR